MQTELCQLFHKYGSDKCPQILHSYSQNYHNLLNQYKTTFKNILEIGIGTPDLMRPIVGDNYQSGAR